MFKFSKIIRDGSTLEILGFEREVEGFGSEVHDGNGNRLGSTTTFGTFDNTMKRIGTVPDAGLLIKKDRK